MTFCVEHEWIAGGIVEVMPDWERSMAAASSLDTPMGVHSWLLFFKLEFDLGSVHASFDSAKHIFSYLHIYGTTARLFVPMYLHIYGTTARLFVPML